MRRTQLYIDDELYRTLSDLSRQQGKSISELVRRAAAEKYMQNESVNRLPIIDRLAGIWKDRDDLKDVDQYVRKLRKDTRRKGFGVE